MKFGIKCTHFLTVFDSWGKHQDGWFSSNRRTQGFQKECMGVDTTVDDGSDILGVQTNANFTGKMCFVMPVSAP